MHSHHVCFEFCLAEPFVFLLDMTELVSGPLQLCLQALNANHCLQQVLVEIGILLLQCPEHRGRIRNRGPAYVNNEGYFDFQNFGFKEDLTSRTCRVNYLGCVNCAF